MTSSKLDSSCSSSEDRGQRERRSLHAPCDSGPSKGEVACLVLAGLVVWAIPEAAARLARLPLEYVDCSAVAEWRVPPLRPVVVRVDPKDEFRRATSVDALLRDHGSANVTLTSANSFSAHERRTDLADYLLNMEAAGTADATWYLFGPQPAGSSLNKLVEEQYTWPKCGAGWCAPEACTLSFGVGGRNSGVSFHTHGPGFAETLHGHKRWLLFPPSDDNPPGQGSFSPFFSSFANIAAASGHHPDKSTAVWARSVLPTLTFSQRRNLVDVVLGPGEALYLPKDWWHATLNLDDTTVFITVFTGGDNEQSASSPGGLLPFSHDTY